MTFQFDAYGVNKNEGTGSNVDWAAYNKYMEETVDCKQKEVVVGVISGIYDLGIQAQKDGEYLFDEKDGTEEEQLSTAKIPGTRFETREKFFNDGSWYENVRVKVVPKKPAQSIAIAVDFPDILVDKGQFFGDESNPQPLRMLLGGEFSLKDGGGRIVAQPIPLTLRKNDKTYGKWSMPHNSKLYKMASAAGLIEDKAPFVPEMLGGLLGKAMQFNLQVRVNDSGFLDEKCAFAAKLSRGMKVPEFDESILHGISFTQDCTEALKQVRASVKNTIKRAENYEGSTVEEQIKALEGAKQAKPSNPAPVEEGFDDDDDAPF